MYLQVWKINQRNYKLIQEQQILDKANSYFTNGNNDKAIFIYAQLCSEFSQNKEYEIYYKLDVQDSTAHYWYKNGKDRLLETKIDSVYQGEFKRWNDDGHINVEGKFIDGKKIGTWTYYNTRNEKIREENYNKQGEPNGTWTEWFGYGGVRSIVNYKNGIKHGKMIYYEKGGKITYEAVFKNNKPINVIKNEIKKQYISKLK